MLLQAPTAAVAADVRSATADVLSSSAYQRELPAAALPETEAAPEPERLPPSEPLRPPEWLFEVAKVLVICLLVAAAIGFALYLYRTISGRARSEAFEDNSAARSGDAAIPADIADPTLNQADALAAEGRFADAVHLLLGAALAYLKRRIAPGLAESLTSREVIDVVSLADAGRSALHEIVDTVEISHFGGRAVDDSDYQVCRACFATLTGVEGARA